MKLYDFKYAVSPMRVRMFLGEKGIAIDGSQGIELINVDMMKGEHRSPEYRAIAPNGLVPSLVVTDNTVLQETMAICRYIELEHPENPLLGSSALEQATIEMWQRKMEMELMMPTAMAFRHANPMAKMLEDQVPEYGEKMRERAKQRMNILNKELANKTFIAGDTFSVADITAYCSIKFFKKLSDTPILPEQENLQRWYDSINTRPSIAWL
ncbi:MAG: glutathione S-transferase [Gammaproteobacteria bacterium]|nr:glutathione S-transferase [Gammaproteobacteria bacterium]